MPSSWALRFSTLNTSAYELRSFDDSKQQASGNSFSCSKAWSVKICMNSSGAASNVPSMDMRLARHRCCRLDGVQKMMILWLGDSYSKNSSPAVDVRYESGIRMVSRLAGSGGLRLWRWRYRPLSIENKLGINAAADGLLDREDVHSRQILGIASVVSFALFRILDVTLRTTTASGHGG